MADAESNLVPSEAADQVEVALEEQAAADDSILYLNEYQYENDLVTDFARLVASPRRRGSLYVAAAIAALIGIGMLVAGGSWIKFGVVLTVFGAFLAWWSKNLHHTLARDFIDAVEADESMGGRYRRVAANEDGLMVWGKSGKSQFFPFEKLDHVLDGERIFVAMFADQGVTIPKDTFVRGDAEQFGPFLKARINKKLRIETKRKKMKAEKAAAKAKQGDKPQETKRKQEEALRPSQAGSLASRYPPHAPERATLAASMPPRTARLRARRSQTNFKRTRVGHAAFLATYRPVLAGRSFGGHQLSRAAQAVPAARDTCDRRFWLHRDLPRHAPAPPRRH